MSTEINNEEKSEPIKQETEEEKKIIENIINSKEEGKQYLEGELHKEFQENKIDSNLTENNNNINNNNINNTEDKNISQQNIFLKDKLYNLKLTKNITNGINKTMDKQMKMIESDIFENKILMTEVPKNINNVLSKSLQRIQNLSNYEKKSKFKVIRELQEEKNNLNLKLQKLMSNEKFLDNEGYMQNSGGENSTNHFSVVDQKVYENKKKLLNEKKTDLLNKIDQIEDQLNQLISSIEDISKKERLKKYIENFERDKEIIETRAKKYFKESKERNQRIANDLNMKAEKRKKEIDDKCKEEELKRVEMLKKLKEQEKDILQKRTKINDEKANKFKPFLKNKVKDDVRQYLFMKKYEEFQKGEKILIDKENLRRKEKMKMDFNEINEFEKNYLDNLEKIENEMSGKKKNLELIWKERKDVLPTYISPKQELVEEELRLKIENEENKKEKNIELNQKRYQFGYDIKNNKQPDINEKLKKQRTDLIRSLENPKLAVKEKLLFERQKKAEELLEKNNSNNNKNANADKNKSSKSTKKILIKLNSSNEKLNDSINLIHKKKIFSPIRLAYPLHPKPKTKIDYLSELRIEKEKKQLKRNAFSNEKDNLEENNNLKWEKAINCEKGTFMENVIYVKEKAKIMDNEVKKKEKILKLYGGVKNNPEIGQKISNLLIDSIEAKLSILNKFQED